MKKSKKLGSFMHRSNKDGGVGASEEVPILKQ